jgi:redox-sensitive bicupin YhaK (pirin superfamily)
MLLAALPIRSAPARIVTRSARGLSSSPLRTPLSDRQQPYRLHKAATAAGSETATMPGIRTVKQVVQGQKQMEGAGVRICRTIGTGALRNLDPFLMLDELKLPTSEATSGFPDHPHRGFETCSIMLKGKMEHHDHIGNHGVIGPGGVQWMTAGRGIVHSEMPMTTGGDDLHGFQLWINLPKAHKMVKPRYQDYQAEDIPIVEKDGVRVRVMAGSSYGAEGPVKMRNPGMLLDVHVSEGATFATPVPQEFTGFCYVYEGTGKIGGAKARIEQNLVMGEGEKVVAEGGSGGLKFLLVAGRPIGEPIVQYGPFVMNSESEIQQAFRDYQTGKLQDPGDDVWAAGD